MTSEPESLSDLTPQQRKSGLAAWLGWMFDGLDMHIYTLVAASFVAILVHSEAIKLDFDKEAGASEKFTADSSGRRVDFTPAASSPASAADGNRDGKVTRDEFAVFSSKSRTGDTEVKEKTSWIQAAFLIGWALGGAFFGRLGDLMGRSRALSLTVLTYAVFTGMSFFAQNWQQLMLFRFLAALGIGGEWAVGSTLLAETWPKKWRPWTAAVLQTGVNIGVIIACIAGILLGGQHPKWIFLIGVAPAVLVYYIRKHVPEPENWAAARKDAVQPRLLDLFGPKILKTTLISVGVCACSLTAWWAFMFWQAQHVRSLPEVVAMSSPDRDTLVATAFAWIIGVSIVGNFAAGGLARLVGFKKALIVMFAGMFFTMAGAFVQPHPLGAMTHFWLPAVGFWSGVFGLFTMLLPPLFPTLLRTTGAGFCYNIGRIAAAAGTIFAAKIAVGGDFRLTLFYTSFLFIPALLFAVFLPLKESTE